MKPITSIDDPRYVKAMSHPVRVRIMGMLQEREASPSQLSKWLGITLGATAYHVRSLHQSGMIELTGETRVRGAVEHHYRARPLPRPSGEEWTSASPVSKQADVSSTLEMIDVYTRSSAATGGFDREEAAITRLSAKLDEKGWKALAAEHRRLVEKVAKIEAEAAKRIEKLNGDGDATHAAVVLLAFEPVALADQLPEPQRKTKSARRVSKRG